MDEHPDLLIGKEELTEYCDAYWVTIQRWIRHEGFPASRELDGKWRAVKKEVVDWFARRTKPPSPA